MSRIRSKDTKPEILVRKYLFSKGFRFRLHAKNLPGKPDILLPKYKTIILIHGCFWHFHSDCRYAVSPKSNTEYWSAKISRNRARDEQNGYSLKQAGWSVLVVWECELKKSNRELTLAALTAAITQNF